MLNLANFIGVSVYVLWYVVVVTTTTCRQLGNDTTYDTEKKNPTSHNVADMSAVSGQHDGKTRRHVVKTNCGRHLKRRHFQLRVILHEFFTGVRLQPVINPMNAIESCVFVFPFFCLCDLAETLIQQMEGSFQVGWKSLCQSILLGSSCWKSTQQA